MLESAPGCRPVWISLRKAGSLCLSVQQLPVEPFPNSYRFVPFSSDAVCFMQQLHNVYTTGPVVFIFNLLSRKAGFVPCWLAEI